MRCVFDFFMMSGASPLEPRLSPSGLVVSYSDPTVPVPPPEPSDDPMPPPEPSPGPFPGTHPPIVYPDPPIGGPVGPG